MKRTVVITRPIAPYAGADQLRRLVEVAGFDAFPLPVLMCRAVALSEADRDLVRSAASGAFTWIVLTSPTAAHFLAELLRELTAKDSGGHFHIAVQGTGTAKAVSELFGRPADFMPSVFVAEDFARELALRISKHDRVLIPLSADSRDVIAPYLKGLGVEVAQIVTYETIEVPVAPSRIDELLALPPAATVFVFMSPSSVQATVRALGPRVGCLKDAKVVSVGPVTSKALREANISMFTEAAEHSEAGVLALLEDIPPFLKSLSLLASLAARRFLRSPSHDRSP